MSKSNRYSPEVRERAVRLVFEQEKEYASQWSAMCSVASEDWVYSGNATQLGAPC